MRVTRAKNPSASVSQADSAGSIPVTRSSITAGQRPADSVSDPSGTLGRSARPITCHNFRPGRPHHDHSSYLAPPLQRLDPSAVLGQLAGPLHGARWSTALRRAPCSGPASCPRTADGSSRWSGGASYDEWSWWGLSLIHISEPTRLGMIS